MIFSKLAVVDSARPSLLKGAVERGPLGVQAKRKEKDFVRFLLVGLGFH